MINSSGVPCYTNDLIWNLKITPQISFYHDIEFIIAIFGTHNNYVFQFNRKKKLYR